MQVNLESRTELHSTRNFIVSEFADASGQHLVNIDPFVGKIRLVLPRDPIARRTFVTSGGLRKVQELLANDAPEGSMLREHALLINACFPQDVINYFSPDYPETLLDRVEQFKPALNIDPSLWTERLFSDTQIPTDIKDEILALQRSMQGENRGSIDLGKKQSFNQAGDLLTKVKK